MIFLNGERNGPFVGCTKTSMPRQMMFLDRQWIFTAIFIVTTDFSTNLSKMRCRKFERNILLESSTATSIVIPWPNQIKSYFRDGSDVTDSLYSFFDPVICDFSDSSSGTGFK